MTDQSELNDLRELVRRICADREVQAERRPRLDGQARGTALAAKLDDLGLAGLLLPESVGGGGGTVHHLVAAADELGRAATTSTLASDAASASVLGGLLDSPDAAPQVRDQLLSAAQRCGGVVLSGRLAPSSAAQSPTDEALIRIVGAAPEWVIVPTGAGEPAGILAVRWDSVETLDETSDVAGNLLARFRIPTTATSVLLGQGATSDVLERARDHARVVVAAGLLGNASGALDMVLEYAKLRHSFGRPIGSYQAYKQRCAEHWLEITIASALLREAVDASAVGSPDAPSLVAACVGLAAEVGAKVCSSIVLMHGAIAFTWEHDAHLFVRDASAASWWLGGPESQLAEVVLARN